MEVWMSWAVFLALVGAGYWYYSQGRPGAARGRTATRSFVNSAKDTAQWMETETKKKVAPKPAKTKAPRKSVKAAVQEAGNKAEAYLSTASTAGADADDDLSPVTTPSAPLTELPSGKNVSDMLGPKSSGPSVLSIKPAEKPARAAKPQAPKAEVAQETKKQRQNKKKVEEAKAQRAEDEKQRQALMEKQRRAAREARDEPAKNGLQPAKAPSSNAWTTVSSGGAVQAPPATSSGQLLDTFDAASTASSSEAPTNGTIPTPDSLSASGHFTNLPSEEEQLRLAMEDSAWTTVPKGGKKQKVKTAGDLTEDGSDSGVPQGPAAVKPVQAAPVRKVENQKPIARYQILSEPFAPKIDDADDWPVV